MSGYANLDSFEGTCSGTATVTFNRRPRKVTITNDSTINSLQFRFSSDHSWATLYPTETVAMEITVKKVLLSGNAAYRIWGVG